MKEKHLTRFLGTVTYEFLRWFGGWRILWWLADWLGGPKQHVSKRCLKEKWQRPLHMVTAWTFASQRGKVYLRMGDSGLSCSHSWMTQWWEKRDPLSLVPEILPHFTSSHKSVPELVSGEAKPSSPSESQTLK